MKPSLLEMQEFFHLAFLRALARKLPANRWAIKGGCNLRFFFGSDRYSVDLDLDVAGVAVHELKDGVMSILGSPALRDTVCSFGVERIIPPRLDRAKQTETVQRFKVHLVGSTGEDLPTKIEFSRRGLEAPIRSEPVLSEVLGAYRLAPLIVPHYAAEAAVRQKIRALLTRRQPEARDVFDLFVLGSRPEARQPDAYAGFSAEELRRSVERVDAIEYERFRDTVLAFLPPADQDRYDERAAWDEIRLAVIEMMERGAGRGL